MMGHPQFPPSSAMTARLYIIHTDRSIRMRGVFIENIVTQSLPRDNKNKSRFIPSALLRMYKSFWYVEWLCFCSSIHRQPNSNQKKKLIKCNHTSSNAVRGWHDPYAQIVFKWCASYYTPRSSVHYFDESRARFYQTTTSSHVVRKVSYHRNILWNWRKGGFARQNLCELVLHVNSR